MRSEAQVYSSVIESLGVVTRADISKLGLETRLVSDLGMESIDTIDLLFEVEKRLDISINLVDVFLKQSERHGRRDQFDMTIKDIVTYITQLTAT